MRLMLLRHAKSEKAEPGEADRERHLNARGKSDAPVIGAYMVEIAQAMAGSGRLTAIRQFVTQACFIVVGPTAGYLGAVAFGWTAAACGGGGDILTAS